MSIRKQASRVFQHPAHLLSALVLAVLPVLAGCDQFLGHNDARPVSGSARYAVMAPAALDGGIIRSIVKAPVAPDGDVAGRTTDLVLNLDVSTDPNEPGFTFRTGDQIKVALPEAFERRSDLPLLDIFACLAQNLACDTAVLLVGWPQGALGAPPPIGYEVSYEGSHTIVFTATEDHLPDAPSNPGLKQIHLLLNNFTNPRPGLYEIGVELATVDGVKHGTGHLGIRPRTRPSIEVTNALHEGFANGNFQETSPHSLTPLPFDFLLWDRTGAPLEGLTIEGGRLVQGGKSVGQITIEAPPGTTGQELFSEAASTGINAPVTGVPAGHLRAFFRAGSATGKYVVTIRVNGGNAVQMVVRVR
jgi:hypothetical protein